MKVCDCGQRYASSTEVLACQERRHAGSAELDAAEALASLTGDELLYSPAELLELERWAFPATKGRAS